MKIIGKTKDNYLAEISEHEIYNIVGIHKYDGGADAMAEKLGARRNHSTSWEGIELPISEIYSTARQLVEGFEKAQSVKMMRDGAEKLINLLDAAIKLYNLPKDKS